MRDNRGKWIPRRQCKECISKRAKENWIKNIDMRRATRLAYKNTPEGREAIKRGNKKWRERHPEQVREIHKKRMQNEEAKVMARVATRKFRKSHLEQYAEYQSRVRSARRKVYESLSDDNKKAILSFYQLAKELTKEYGIKFVVDHYYPIKGKDSCGLHVPWNMQVIPYIENSMKHNKNPEMFYAEHKGFW